MEARIQNKGKVALYLVIFAKGMKLPYEIGIWVIPFLFVHLSRLRLERPKLCRSHVTFQLGIPNKMLKSNQQQNFNNFGHKLRDLVLSKSTSEKLPKKV